MTVAELIEQLQKYPGETKVVYSSGQVVELHGVLDSSNVSFSKKRDLTDEQRAEIADRFRKNVSL